MSKITNLIDFSIYAIALFLATYVILVNEAHQTTGAEAVVVVFGMLAIAKMFTSHKNWGI